MIVPQNSIFSQHQTSNIGLEQHTELCLHEECCPVPYQQPSQQFPRPENLNKKGEWFSNTVFQVICANPKYMSCLHLFFLTVHDIRAQATFYIKHVGLQTMGGCLQLVMHTTQGRLTEADEVWMLAHVTGQHPYWACMWSTMLSDEILQWIKGKSIDLSIMPTTQGQKSNLTTPLIFNWFRLDAYLYDNTYHKM